MSARPRRHRAVTLGVGVTAIALLLTSCGKDSDNKTAAPKASADSALTGLVPAQVKSDGKLVFGTDASYPPNEYTDVDGRTVVGWEVDLGKALAEKLGLKAEFQNSKFDTIIAGVQSGKYEIGLSSFTDNKDREKAVDFVTYYSAGTSWAALKGNPKGVNPDDACGKKIGVQTGTVQQTDDIPARQKKCKTAGKTAIEVVPRTQQTEVNTDLVSGKTDAMLADSPIVGYAIKQTGDKLEILGQTYGTAPYGLAIGQNSGQLKDAVLGALKALIADGTYKSILEKVGAQDGAITDPKINGAQ